MATNHIPHRTRRSRHTYSDHIAESPDHPAEHSPDTAPSKTDTGTAGDLQLYTPADAAEILSVKETWLRRKAGTRSIPCTFLGRHLRFSTADLRAITTRGAQPPRAQRGRPRST